MDRSVGLVTVHNKIMLKLKKKSVLTFKKDSVNMQTIAISATLYQNKINNLKSKKDNLTLKMLITTI